MSFTQDFRTQRRNYADGNIRIGELGRLWYDGITNTIRISDGLTPGGRIVTGGAVGGTITVSEIGADNGITNETTNVTALRFDTDTGFNVTDLGEGNVKVSLGSSWKTWQVDGQDSLVAVGEDTVTFVAGANISITTNAISKTITFSSDGGKGDKGDKGDTGEQGPPGISGQIATANTVGTVKIGANSNINLSPDGSISVPVATATTLGVVKPGTNVTIDAAGALNVNRGAGINKVADVPDVNSTAGGASLRDGALLVYNASSERWDTVQNLRSNEMDGGFF